MSDLARLVETLFALRGYIAEPGQGAVLRFRKHGDRIAVKVRDSKDPVPSFVAREVADTLPALGHAILICPGDLGHEARVILETAAIDVWTREKLIHEVGKSYLEAAEHGALPKGFAPPIEDGHAAPDAPPAPPAPVAGPPSAPIPVPASEPPAPPAAAPTLPVSAPSLWTRVPTPAAPAPPPTPPATAATLFPVRAAAPPAKPLAPDTVHLMVPLPAPAETPATVAPAERFLASRLTRDEVMRLATGRLLRVDKAELELVPLHAFRYHCKLEAKGAPPVPKQGLVAIDAVTGAPRELPEPSFGPSEGGSKLTPVLPDVDAAHLAKRKVIEVHTQKMRVQNAMSRNTLIVEDKWVRPDPGSMTLDHQGVWWLPLWRLEGQNGSLCVNGATGAFEDEKLKRAFADSAEFI